MKADFLTPVGRLVQGDPFEAQTKNMQGQPLMTMSGQATQRYFIAVAFRKDDPGFAALYQKLVETAKGSFPTLFDAAGNCVNPRFSWKLMDGDGVDDNGKSNKNKEGFAGHYVLKFSSSFAPKCFHAGHYQPHEQIQDPKAIPRGYFVRVAGSIEGNNNPQKPGLYVNLGMVELAGVGPLITSGPDASSVFGGNAPALPVGAQPLPMHAVSVPVVAPSLPIPNAPQVAVNPALPTSIPVMPNPAFLMPSPAMPAALPTSIPMPAALPTSMPMPPQTMPVAPAHQMTAAADGFTREQYLAQGWADNALRAAGKML